MTGVQTCALPIFPRLPRRPGARDALGTVSAWTAETCTAVPLDDRSLSRLGSWTAGTGSAYFRSTYLRSYGYGAKLVRTGVVAHSISGSWPSPGRCDHVPDLIHPASGGGPRAQRRSPPATKPLTVCTEAWRSVIHAGHNMTAFSLDSCFIGRKSRMRALPSSSTRPASTVSTQRPIECNIAVHSRK